LASARARSPAGAPYWCASRLLAVGVKGKRET
jgi:hypothetical protein